MWWLIATGILALFLVLLLRGAPYVPTKRSVLAAAFEEVYPLRANDTLLDLGSGDGVVLRLAAKRGAQAVGYELNPLLVWISRFLSRGNDRITVRMTDFWLNTFPDDTTVIYMFGVSRDMTKLVHKVEQEATRLGRPLHILSYAFSLAGHTPIRHNSTHFLYQIHPLQ